MGIINNINYKYNPKISIITVCLNSIKTIQDTIDSIDSQVDVDIEHIVIDGGSTDGTLELLLNNNKSWRIVKTSLDKNLYDAMNKGVSIATGDIITFLNSDDFYADSKILSEIANEFKIKNIDGCYGDLVYIKRDNIKHVVRYWKSGPYLKNSLSNGWILPHPTVFIRADYFKMIGNFNINLKIAADYEFLVRMLMIKDINLLYIPKIFVKMRIGGLSTKSYLGIIKQNFEIYKIIKHYNLTNSYTKFFILRFINKILQKVCK